MEAVQDYTALKPELAAAANDHGEPKWVVDRRLAAIDDLADAALPEVNRFDIHRWPLTPAEPLAFSPSATDLAANVPVAADHVQIVQVGQTTVAVNLPAELADQGVILTDIFTAFREHPELTQPAFMTDIIKSNEDRLTSFHTAFLNAGVFLYVPQGVVIDAPIEIHLVQDSTQDDRPLVSHVLVIAGTDSHFAVTQHLTTQGDHANLASCVVEVRAQANSEVHFSSFDELGPNTTTYLNRRANISRNANVDWAIGLMNDGDTFGDFDSELIGENSKSDAKVITLTGGRQRVGVNTRVTNRGKKSTGNILQRGVIMEKSTLIFNGIGHIIHGAAGANAEQENRVLMMSSKAHGDANPILLIDENDVLAGHAASVGQVDAKQMYYLMSRGITEPQAKRLVIRGFLSAVLQAIPAKDVRQNLTDTIERKLENGAEVE